MTSAKPKRARKVPSRLLDSANQPSKVSARHTTRRAVQATVEPDPGTSAPCTDNRPSDPGPSLVEGISDRALSAIMQTVSSSIMTQVQAAGVLSKPKNTVNQRKRGRVPSPSSSGARTCTLQTWPPLLLIQWRD